MELDILMLDRIINTMMIIVCGCVALFGVVYNRRLVTDNPKKKQFSNFVRITTSAPHMKEFLSTNIYIVYFLSTLILSGIAYFVFVEQITLGFAICGVIALIELYVLLRVIRVEKAYISFIDRAIIQEPINENEESNRMRIH